MFIFPMEAEQEIFVSENCTMTDFILTLSNVLQLHFIFLFFSILYHNTNYKMVISNKT